MTARDGDLALDELLSQANANADDAARQLAMIEASASSVQAFQLTRVKSLSGEKVIGQPVGISGLPASSAVHTGFMNGDGDQGEHDLREV